MAIQQALFLAPTRIHQILTHDKDFHNKDFPKRVEDIPCYRYVVVGEVNPFLARICGPVLSNDDDRLDIVDELATISPRESFEYPAGPWREWFITKPPTFNARISLYPKEETEKFVERQEKMLFFRCNEGIRLGQLYDYIDETVKGFRVRGKQVAFRIVLPDFHPQHLRKRRNWAWEVRKGLVVGQILPRILPPSRRKMSYGKSNSRKTP